MDDKTFILQLITEIPEARENVLDDDNLDLTSLQIMSFRSFTQKAINTNNLELVGRCLAFVDKVFDVVSDGVNNSLYISYLGKLDFKGNNQLTGLLSAKLSNAIQDLNRAYAKDSKNENFKDFTKSLGSEEA